MAEVIVTQTDRMAAIRLRFGDGEPHELYLEWARSGESRHASEYPTSSFGDAIARMEMLARAHAMGRAAEQSAALRMLRRWLKNGRAAAATHSSYGNGTVMRQQGLLNQNTESVIDALENGDQWNVEHDDEQDGGL